MAKTGGIRALAVTAVFLAGVALGLPAAASAQTAAERQAVGILFLLGSPRSGTQANAKTPGQKPKPGIAASQEGKAKSADVKQKPVSVPRKLDRSAQLRDSPHAMHN